MQFSIFLNTRGRPKQLLNCIKSLEETACYPQQIEMLLRADDDDAETIQVLDTLNDRKTFLFRPVIGPRPKNLVVALNELVRMAVGRFVFIVNDDSEMQTMHWDKIVSDKVNEFQKARQLKDDIIFAAIKDNSVDKPPGSDYPSFAIVTKKATEVLGFFTYECFVGLGGDSSMYRIYQAVDRVVQVPEVWLDHIYHSSLFRVLTPDQTAHEMRELSAQYPVNPFTLDVSADVLKLKQYIESL